MLPGTSRNGPLKFSECWTGRKLKAPRLFFGWGLVVIDLVSSPLTLTIKDCKGPQTNMPKNAGSTNTWSAKIMNVDILNSASRILQCLKSGCADIFHQSFLWLLRHTDEPQKEPNSCLWLQSHSVLIGVLSVSCWCLAELSQCEMSNQTERRVLAGNSVATCVFWAGITRTS